MRVLSQRLVVGLVAMGEGGGLPPRLVRRRISSSWVDVWAGDAVGDGGVDGGERRWSWSMRAEKVLGFSKVWEGCAAIVV